MLLQNRTIYIVEDMPENIYVLQTFLRVQKAHVIVDWFANGDVSRVLNALPIDLIILDLMLPKRSGFNIFQDLRSLPQLASVPIVAVSAMDSSIGIPEAQAVGFSGFISKPINTDLFAQQLLDLIQGKAVWYGS